GGAGPLCMPAGLRRSLARPTMSAPPEVRMRVAPALAVTLGFMGLSWGAVAAQHAPTGTWAEKAKMADARTEAGVAAYRGRIYVFGGMTRGEDSHRSSLEYSPATDKWRERAPMPGPLSHPGA